MGLDMYLTATIPTSKYENKELNALLKKNFPKQSSICDNLDSIDITFEAAYWRKANHIHKWFVDNCQGGRDECQKAYVAREDLEKLIKVCEDSLKEEDHRLLPPADGFFFGGVCVDEYYWNDTKNTVKNLKKILKTFHEETQFTYQSSW